MDYAKKYEKGQTLVALLFFILIGLAVTIAATIILSINALAVTKLTQGEVARGLAETGAEEALIELLRDKNYSGTHTLNIDGNTVIMEVSGGATKTITSTGQAGSFIRKVEVVASYDGVLTPISWKEIF